MKNNVNYLFIGTLRKKCYWIESISFKKHVYHGFKSICYRISNIFIGSCSIFLWINSIINNNGLHVPWVLLDIASTPKIAKNCREKTLILVTVAVYTHMHILINRIGISQMAAARSPVSIIYIKLLTIVISLNQRNISVATKNNRSIELLPLFQQQHISLSVWNQINIMNNNTGLQIMGLYLLLENERSFPG